MHDANVIDRALDLKLAEAIGIAVYYNEWDSQKEIPMHIPSGKPWNTHSMEAKPLPNYSRNYGAAFSLLDLLKEMVGFKLERGISEWWWCGIAFSSGLSAKGEGETAPVAICHAVLASLDIYPAVPLHRLTHERLMEICKKRYVKGWTEHSTKEELIGLLTAQ